MTWCFAVNAGRGSGDCFKNSKEADNLEPIVIYLESDVRTIQNRINATPLERTDALEYWFMRLDLAKCELFLIGSLYAKKASYRK